MASKRTLVNDLARLLNKAPEPIYALDEELTIIFLNRACQEWIRADAEGLIGVRAGYHSAPDAASSEGVAAGLAPPPEAFAGQVASALVSVPAGNGEEKHRQAKFIPLGTAEQLHGILAILAMEDAAVEFTPVEEFSVKEPDSADLHAAIRCFRREAAGRWSAEHLIGISAAMQLARRQVEAAGASGCSVCISGLPGSGRERLAAAIHYVSNPADANLPFAQSGMIALDCSVLPAELILSTLAALARPHVPNANVEKIAPTTLVLNHVDELPDELQTELFALFSKRPFPRRLISTSAMPLGELAQRGKFRPDLAALLGTMCIQLPPLKDRREDLPLLAQIFLEECNRQGAKQVGGFTPEAIDRLDAYAWPGNLNELIEIVSAAHSNAQGTEVMPDELPPQIHLAAQAAAHPRKAEESIKLDEFLGRVERELIRRAVARSKGNKAKAARLLGLSRTRLLRRMKQLGLEDA
jgi:DNA-binding NtrC family response regulator